MVISLLRRCGIFESIADVQDSCRYLAARACHAVRAGVLLLTFASNSADSSTRRDLIAEGASWDVVLRVLATLLPQSLGITIPMALLGGILFALGRRPAIARSSRWSVRHQLGRLLRPLVLSRSSRRQRRPTSCIVALPAANQAFREITFRADSFRAAKAEIKPRVFTTVFRTWSFIVRRSHPASDGRMSSLRRRVSRRNTSCTSQNRGRLAIDESKRSSRLFWRMGLDTASTFANPRSTCWRDSRTPRCQLTRDGVSRGKAPRRVTWR